MIKLAFALLVLLLVGVSLLFGQVRRAATDIFEFVKIVFKRYFCLPVAQVLGYFIGPSDKSEGLIGRNLYMWIALHGTFFAALLLLQPTAFTLSAVIFLTLLHLCIIAIALFVIKEETEIWDGLLLREEAAFGSITFIKGPGVLFVSTVFSLLFIALWVMQWDAVTSYRIVSSAPEVDCRLVDCKYLSYAIAVGHQLPGISFLIRKVGLGEVVFSQWPGSFVAWAIYTVTWLWVFGVYAVLWRQWRETSDLLIALEKATDHKTIEFLQRRAARAPSAIKRKLLSMAVSHPNPVMRHRAISIVPEAKIYTFPQTFLYHAHNQPKDIKLWGLKKIEQFLETDRDRFDAELVSKTLGALVHQTGRNRPRHEASALKRMDALVMAYAELAGHINAPGLSSGRLRERILDIVVLGDEDGVRRKAFEYSAKTDSIGLCHRVVDGIDYFAFIDAAWGEEALGKCLEVVKEHRGEWKPRSLTSLRNRIDQVLTRRPTARRPGLAAAVKQKLDELKGIIAGPSSVGSPNPGKRGSAEATSNRAAKQRTAPVVAISTHVKPRPTRPTV